MKRNDPFAVTETYSFALAPVIGPFFEALGALARNLGEARSTLKAKNYFPIESGQDDD
jgi:hypothetical protein